MGQATSRKQGRQAKATPKPRGPAAPGEKENPKGASSEERDGPRSCDHPSGGRILVVNIDGTSNQFGLKVRLCIRQHESASTG